DTGDSGVVDMDLDDSPDMDHDPNTEETPVWKGQFVFDETWYNGFFQRDFTYVRKGESKPYGLKTIKDLKGKQIWKLYKFGREPFKNVDESFASLEAYYEQNGNTYSTMRKDLDALKLFLKFFTPEERNNLIQDEEFSEKLDVFYKHVVDCVEEQTMLQNQRATLPEKKTALPIPVIVEKTTKFQNDIINNGIENATLINLQACGHVSMQVLNNGGGPRRLDYLDVVAGRSPKGNYYYDGRIVLKNYKTNRSYGDYEIDVTPQTKIILDRLAEMQGVGKLLFRLPGVGDLTHITKQHFKIVTGKRIYVTLLRYLYVSHRQMNGTLVSQEARERLANQMGNSVLLQQMIYTKIDILDDYNREHNISVPAPAAPITAESNEQPRGSKPAATIPATKPTKRQRIDYTTEEDKQLEAFLTAHGPSYSKIRKVAHDQGLALGKREPNSLRGRAETIKDRRLKANKPLGAFEK
ncbi:hypothetical protein HDU87_003286, partial [Geranomyces variabilis]